MYNFLFCLLKAHLKLPVVNEGRNFFLPSPRYKNIFRTINFLIIHRNFLVSLPLFAAILSRKLFVIFCITDISTSSTRSLYVNKVLVMICLTSIEFVIDWKISLKRWTHNCLYFFIHHWNWEIKGGSNKDWLIVIFWLPVMALSRQKNDECKIVKRCNAQIIIHIGGGGGEGVKRGTLLQTPFFIYSRVLFPKVYT